VQCACAILPSVACLALQYVSTLSHKKHDFRKIVTEHKMCFLFSQQLLSEAFVILRRHVRDMIEYVSVFMLITRFSCPVLMKFDFPDRFSKNLQKITLQEAPSIGSRVVSCGQTEGWRDRGTDLTKLILAFCNFANASKKMFASPQNINFIFINTQIQNTSFAFISLRLFTRTS